MTDHGGTGWRQRLRTIPTRHQPDCAPRPQPVPDAPALPAGLPGWEQMTPLDQGAALVHLCHEHRRRSDPMLHPAPLYYLDHPAPLLHPAAGHTSSGCTADDGACPCRAGCAA